MGSRRSPLRKRLIAVQDRIAAHMTETYPKDSRYGQGLHGEGWMGGYQQALRDVEAVLAGWEPNDSRSGRFWRAPSGDREGR